MECMYHYNPHGYYLFFYRLMKKLLIALLLLLPIPGMASKPARIISLDLCTDWMLLKYAEQSSVLALSPLVKRFPADWIKSDITSHDGSLEQILTLEPDLVLVGEFNASLLRQRLDKLGVNVVSLSLPKTLQQVHEYEQNFLEMLGESRDRATTAFIKRNSEGVGPRLLLLGANGGGTGHDTLEHEMIELAGWQNYVTEPGYTRLELEKLVVDPPDAIMWSAPASKALANNFMQHPALKHAIPAERWLETDYGNWQCQGPWTWEQVKQLQQARKQWYAPQH